MKSLKHCFLPLLLSFLISCSTTKKATQPAPATAISGLKFLGQYIVPHNFKFENTTVGGLSGIDYDAVHGQYYMICDDRSAINPARFYTAKIRFTANGIDTVQFIAVHNLLQANGQVYPNSKKDPVHTPDPEAMRYDAPKDQLVWSSEGERIVKLKDTVLENPAITLITPTGKYIDTFPLPPQLLMHATEYGPRQNGVLEGMCFADNYKTLYVSVEEPLYQDGPRADVTPGNAYTRILKYDMATKKNTAQFAYLLDPIAHPSVPANAFKINGIPDILSIGNNRLLIIERSFSSGRLACTIKVFVADLNNATDVKNLDGLRGEIPFVLASKKLLLNMDDLGIYIDNIEGMTFGPVLPNGHKTIVFVADNNFDLLEKTQFMLFEVTE